MDKHASSSNPVVLVLDSLDQLSDDDAGRELDWLPKQLPDNVYMILSTLPGEEYICLPKLQVRKTLFSIPTIIMASGNVVPILDISPKQIYQIFLQQKQIAPTAKQKLTNKYSNIEIDWEKVYTLAFQCTLDTKIREFKYKILNCIIFTNEKLNLIGVVESPNCTFCQEATESVEHLLFSCRITSNLWKHVLSWLRDNDVHVGIINELDIIFGKFDIVKDYILINHILLLGKYYIYYRKCQNSIPTLSGFIARTRRVFNIELHISREKNKLLFHLQKWEKLINELK